MKAPVEAVSEGGPVAGPVVGKVEGVGSAAETVFEVTQEGVDPTELWHFLGFAQADEDGLVLAAGRDDAVKAGQPIGKDPAAGAKPLDGGLFQCIHQFGSVIKIDLNHRSAQVEQSPYRMMSCR